MKSDTTPAPPSRKIPTVIWYFSLSMVSLSGQLSLWCRKVTSLTWWAALNGHTWSPASGCCRAQRVRCCSSLERSTTWEGLYGHRSVRSVDRKGIPVEVKVKVRGKGQQRPVEDFGTRRMFLLRYFFSVRGPRPV